MVSSYLLLLPIVLSQPARATTTLDPNLLLILQRVARYAGSAYCAKNYVAVNTPASFPPTPFDVDGSAQLGASFLNVGDYNSTGLLMLDHANEAIVIVFRGTVSNADWDTNLDFLREDASDICGPGCVVHGGFFNSWNASSDIVFRNWRTLRERYSNYTTILMGHSLGGALAHVCAAALKHAEPNVTMSLHTYASPRVGNQVFADYITQHFGQDNYRLTHLNDPVPRLPGRFLGFAHAGPEYHITSPDIKKVLSASKRNLATEANMLVRPSDVLVFSGPENDAGNVGFSCANIAMHDEYFIHIADCVVSTGTPLLQSFAKSICHGLLMCCNFGLNFGTMWHPDGDGGGSTKVTKVLDAK